MKTLLLSLLLLTASARAQLLPGEVAQPGQRDTGGVRPPTMKLEHGRTIFVQSSCHFCHGVDLTQAQMGAADLMHDQLVAADVDGNLIGAIVKAGLPNLQTSMPAFADLTPQQISDLAAYVHYLRQQGRYKEATAYTQPGSATAGKSFFDGEGGCTKCHSVDDMKSAAKKYSAADLRAHMLMPPGAVPKEGVTPSAGDVAHLHLLETASAAQMSDVASYLEELK